MGLFLELPSNPFGLVTPSPGWQQAIADYDSDLVLFASQKDPCYRLCRKAHKSGGLTAKYLGKTPSLNPDTKICIDHHLVPVTTLPPLAVSAPPHLIVQQLRGRDQWLHGGGTDDAAADRVADLLDTQDVTREANVDAHNLAGLKDRVRPMRTSYLYRTGARVSLIKPPGASVAGTLPDTIATATGDAP